MALLPKGHWNFFPVFKLEKENNYSWRRQPSRLSAELQLISCIIETVNKIEDYHGLRKLEFDVTKIHPVESLKSSCILEKCYQIGFFLKDFDFAMLNIQMKKFFQMPGNAVVEKAYCANCIKTIEIQKKTCTFYPEGWKSTRTWRPNWENWKNKKEKNMIIIQWDENQPLTNENKIRNVEKCKNQMVILDSYSWVLLLQSFILKLMLLSLIIISDSDANIWN